MKKLISLALCAALCAMLFAGCGSTATDAATTATTTETTQPAPAYASALEVLEAIWAQVPEDQRFAVAGGDEAHPTEGPGTFDAAAYGDTFRYQILVDDALMANLTGDAATLMHMMNMNTFCSAAMAVTEGTDTAAFAESYKTLVQGNRWMCGFPETMLVMELDNFVITAYGHDGNIQNFKTAALAIGATLLVEAPAEG